jgi:hypothetical protein
MKRTRCRPAAATALALVLVGSTAALAAPLNGKTYQGAVPSSGVRSEGHHRVKLHAGGNIVLRVASNGKTVSVRFTSTAAVLYCNTTKRLQVQSTKATKITSSGSFRASISQRFSPGPGLPPIVQVITGHFSGHTVNGKIITQAAQCSGVTGFSAHA